MRIFLFLIQEMSLHYSINWSTVEIKSPLWVKSKSTDNPQEKITRLSTFMNLPVLQTCCSFAVQVDNEYQLRFTLYILEPHPIHPFYRNVTVSIFLIPIPHVSEIKFWRSPSKRDLVLLWGFHSALPRAVQCFIPWIRFLSHCSQGFMLHCHGKYSVHFKKYFYIR